MQKAIDVGYNKMDGTLRLGELNEALANGWRVADNIYPVMSGGGDILVIVEQVEKEDKAPQQ